MAYGNSLEVGSTFWLGSLWILLPEAKVDVTSAPPARSVLVLSITTASFLTKLSGFGDVFFESVPDSTLVLKANAASDMATQQLLRRRMLRVGLNPERITWIPLTVVIRSICSNINMLILPLILCPNGGCTTTCEALWMGAPVITKAGSSYVSRMSTAVLAGCGLHDWVATDELLCSVGC